MNPFENLTLIEPPLRISPDALLAEGRRRVRRRRLLVLTASPALLIGGAGLVVSLLTGGASPRTDAVIPPAGTPARETGSTPLGLLPKDAAPAAVLDTYLRALSSGDCNSAHSLATSTFTAGNGELCGHLTVKSYTPLRSPANPNDREVVFATNLVTQGGDASMPDGLHTWFYTLVRQTDGAWRLVGGGSGP
jgi:hypothetical protein